MARFKHRYYISGFTLIEALLYAAILSIFIGMAFLVASQTLETTGKLRDKLVVTEETEFVLKKIDWALIDVSAVTAPAPNATSTTLTITKTGFVSNPISFTWDGLNMFISRGAASSTQLNNSKIIVSKVLVEHLKDNLNNQSIIKVTLIGQSRSLGSGTKSNASTTLQTAYTF